MDALNSSGWGVFIALTTKTAVGEGCCRWAHQTVWCATGHCPVRQPRHPTVRVLTVSTVGALTAWGTRQSSAAPDSHCSLSGAPSDACSNSARTVRALFSCQSTVEDDRCAGGRCSAGTPDSSVNYSGVRLRNPKVKSLKSIHPGAPDTVRWHTEKSGAPDQGSLRFLLLLSFEP
jgi:hypothetical protein